MIELVNDRVYPVQDIEQWLSESANPERGSRAWKKALRDASQIEVGEDVYFFAPISATHCRVHRGNAKEVKAIFAALRKASRPFVMRKVVALGFMTCTAVCALIALLYFR